MIGYFKGEPWEYVFRYARGRLISEGLGLSFFFQSRTTTVLSVPVNTVDQDFIFNEMTANFQAVTIQGQVTSRIAQPKRVASLLNYAIEPRHRGYLSQDPPKLAGRVINLVQEAARAEVQRASLEDLLNRRAGLAAVVLARVRAAPEMEALGVEVLNVFLTAMKPTPEVSKALEADYRESLLKRADQAIYDRRATAVEQERRIQQNELGTEIALEKERERLVELRAGNMAKEAEADAGALEARLRPYRTMDPGVLMALAFKSLSEGSGKIASLTITPDLLSELLKVASAVKGR